MISFLLLASTAVAPPVAPIVGEAEAEFRRGVTETCPRILSEGRAFFTNESRLAHAGLTVSPMFKTMAATSGIPLAAQGKHVMLIFNDNGTTRNTKIMCMVNGRPGVDVIAFRDRYFSTLAPTPKMIKALRKNDFVGFAYPEVDGVKAHVVVFWRDGVFVKPPEAELNQ